MKLKLVVWELKNETDVSGREVKTQKRWRR